VAIWRTVEDGLQALEETRLAGTAVWHPDGEPEFAYADFVFDPASLAFNVAPGE
jgi:hypothetical protein